MDARTRSSGGFAWLAMACLVLPLTGCANEIKITTTTDIVVEAEAVDQGSVEEIFNNRKLYGVAIGVSFYGEKARSDFPSMPAHALSAGVFADSLYRSYVYREEERQGGMRLVTDLRLKLGDSGNRAVLSQFASAVGVDAISPYSYVMFGGVTPNKDGTWPFFGNNLPIGKAQMHAAIARAIQQMESGVKTEGTITGVFYVSAHGVVGPDNVAYVIPGDATSADPSTWIRLNDLFKPIYDFAKDGGNSELNKRILVVVDICQRGGKAVLPVDTPPRGVALILSASPGQYAWHFVSKEHVMEKTINSLTGERVESGVVKSTMSFLPIAMRRSFAELAGRLLPVEGSIESQKDLYRRNITVGALAEAMKKQITELAQSDEAVKKSGGQDMVAHYGDGARDMNFLTLVNAANKFQLPYQKRPFAGFMSGGLDSMR